MSADRSITIRELEQAITKDEPVDEKIIITELNPYNFLSFMVVLQLNPSIKTIKIKEIDDPSSLKVIYAESIKAIVAINTTLRSLDFGNMSLPEEVAKPFVEVFGQLQLDDLQIKSTPAINESVAYYKKRNQWLVDVACYFIESYLNDLTSQNSEQDTQRYYFIKELTSLLVQITENKLGLNQILDWLYKYKAYLKKEGEKENFNTFKQLLALIIDMKNYCVEREETPMNFLVFRYRLEDIKALHAKGFKEMLATKSPRGNPPVFALTCMDLTKFTEILDFFLKLGFDINTVNSMKVALIHEAATSQNPGFVYLLKERGAELNMVTKFGDTPLSMASSQNNQEVVMALKKLGASDPNLEKTIKRRILFYVFGQKKLEDAIKDTKIEGILEGGWEKETYVTLIPYFKKFIDNYQHKVLHAPQKLNRILKHLEDAYENLKLNSNEFLQKLQSSNPEDLHYFVTGSLGHIVGVGLQKYLHGFQLSITERGWFSTQFTSAQDDKIFSVKQIFIPEEKLVAVVDLLIAATQSDPEKAKKILFKKIPKLVGSDYSDLQEIQQSVMKMGLCFFSNPMIVLYLDIMQSFGYPDPKVAQQIFKDFGIFMREQALEDFNPHAKDSVDHLLVLESQKIITDKKTKQGADQTKLVSEKLGPSNNKR